jgi:hypothetical protein
MRAQPSPVTVEVSDSEDESASEAPPPASPSAAAQDSPGPRVRAFTLSPPKAPRTSGSSGSSEEEPDSSDDDAAQSAPAQAGVRSDSDAEDNAEPTTQEDSDSSESEATDSSSEEMPRVRPDSARTWCTQCTTTRAFRHTTTTFHSPHIACEVQKWPALPPAKPRWGTPVLDVETRVETARACGLKALSLAPTCFHVHSRQGRAQLTSVN